MVIFQTSIARMLTGMKSLASMNSRCSHPVYYSRPVAGAKYSSEPEFTVSQPPSCRTWDTFLVCSVPCHACASDNQVPGPKLPRPRPYKVEWCGREQGNMSQ